jgi:hypothetical protein
LDDDHHPALITKGNLGLLTFQMISDWISVRGSGMIFHLLCWFASHQTANSLTTTQMYSFPSLLLMAGIIHRSFQFGKNPEILEHGYSKVRKTLTRKGELS